MTQCDGTVCFRSIASVEHCKQTGTLMLRKLKVNWTEN